jgi:hypothetical protein
MRPNIGQNDNFSIAINIVQNKLALARETSQSNKINKNN